ncbi:sentrin-specific protease 5-like [Syngnathus typhle]
MWKPIPSFRVVFKKHTLTLDDLTTLAYQNWLNDQVINMYGELIMEAAQHKVHFFNSFFHRQLMTKGYCGCQVAWWYEVDLFSKSLLLVPIHLEVHWCLVATDVVRKKICLFDSQGNELLDVVQNILNYLIVEAREKRRTSFINGWTMSLEENVPQQTNENVAFLSWSYFPPVCIPDPLPWLSHSTFHRKTYRILRPIRRTGL